MSWDIRPNRRKNIIEIAPLCLCYKAGFCLYYTDQKDYSKADNMISTKYWYHRERDCWVRIENWFLVPFLPITTHVHSPISYILWVLISS